ncbi:unnamed protein product [Diplocarpon coronariae]
MVSSICQLFRICTCAEPETPRELTFTQIVKIENNLGFNITGSKTIFQSAADLDSSTYYPKDLKARTDVNRWFLWEASVWFPSCYVYLGEPDQAIIDAQAPRWNQLASILDVQLARTKWLAGNETTIADIAVASRMHIHKASVVPLDKHSNLKYLMQETVKLPYWGKTQGAIEEALLPDGQVLAPFNYTKDVDRRAEIHLYESETSRDTHEPGDDPPEMMVHGRWPQASSFSLGMEGFSLHLFISEYDGPWEIDVSVREYGRQSGYILKTHESENDGRARFIGRTAFEDPVSKPGAKIRRSIDVRATAFFWYPFLTINHNFRTFRVSSKQIDADMGKLVR